MGMADREASLPKMKVRRLLWRGGVQHGRYGHDQDHRAAELKSKSPSSRRNSELYPRAIDEKKAPIGA